MNENTTNDSMFRRLVPPVAAVMAIILFVNRGLWQLDRAAEKQALESLFANDAPYRQLADINEPTPFERVEARGRLLEGTQILIDNIVKNGRLGYYVITPLEHSRNDPLLLVNRGWLAREDFQQRGIRSNISADASANVSEIRGLVGNLPRVGVRGGPGFVDGEGEWPRIGVYPTTEEVSTELGRSVLPYVLLLDPDDTRGYLRDWQPTQSGPMTNYGYAFQWFAMALAVVAVAAWQLIKRRRAA